MSSFGHRKNISNMVSAQYIRTVSLLSRGDYTLQQLIDQIGVNKETMGRLVEALRRHKLVYVREWLPDVLGRRTVALLAWGPDTPDAPRVPVDQAERQRRYWERRKMREEAHRKVLEIAKNVPSSIFEHAKQMEEA